MNSLIILARVRNEGAGCMLGSVVELASALRSYEVGRPPLRSELAWLVLHSIPLALVPNEFAEFDNT